MKPSRRRAAHLRLAASALALAVTASAQSPRGPKRPAAEPPATERPESWTRDLCSVIADAVSGIDPRSDEELCGLVDLAVSSLSDDESAVRPVVIAAVWSVLGMRREGGESASNDWKTRVFETLAGVGNQAAVDILMDPLRRVSDERIDEVFLAVSAMRLLRTADGPLRRAVFEEVLVWWGRVSYHTVSGADPAVWNRMRARMRRFRQAWRPVFGPTARALARLDEFEAPFEEGDDAWVWWIARRCAALPWSAYRP